MDVSDNIDKSWDHPWTTEEMRTKRREWNLAGDVGLLKHLQQFSENLVSKASKTQGALNTLTTQLKETGILVDNVTNTSLALANTQFIESRVRDDDIEVTESSEERRESLKVQSSLPENLIANISENVKQGLNIMDERYKVMDVACSDSEEDDGGAIVFSVIVGPNDPYQDRPLPYVIGSDKWVASNKIGLESSSSESEQEKEESESDTENVNASKIFNNRHNPKINIGRLSSSSSDTDNYNDRNTPYMNSGKVNAMFQNNINSVSESITPNNISKNSNETTPNFAEELAKRLGTVRQAQKPIGIDEASESSINRLKDDLFASEKNEDVFNDSSDNLFRDKKNLFDDQISADLWKEKLIKSYSSNIIPPSIDVPPPISIISAKPKSAIDDLFADADSEDSDDIFSSKNTVKKHTKVSSDNGRTSAHTEEMPRTFLDAIAPATTSHVATSTPESNVNVSNLFNDDEDDDGDLFSAPKKHSYKPGSISPSTNTIPVLNKKRLVGAVPILGHVSASDIENKLSSRIMQRRSSDSFNSDTPRNDGSARSTEPASEERAVLNDNITVDRSFIVANPAENISANIENSNSSGISIHPPSIDNTAGSGLWVNFQPEMSSTRLKSEEIYRERITSDSLFAARTRDFAGSNSTSTNTNSQQPQQEQHDQDISSALLQDDVFENDNLFGPPPLPSNSDSKRVKSKVSSLFDDSDSGDELFSAASSSSRSQKSSDFLVTANDKTKPVQREGGLFEEDIDIFGGKDCPDVDIFGAVSKSKSKEITSDDLFDSRGQGLMITSNNNVEKSQSTRMDLKKTILFDDDDDGDLFGAKSKSNNDRKPEVVNTNDLFSAKASDKNLSLAKKDALNDQADATDKVPIFDSGKKSKGFSENEVFSNTSRTSNLLFEDDDYDDLFSKKNATTSDSDKEIKQYIVEQTQEFSEKDKNPSEFSNLDNDIKTCDSDIMKQIESGKSNSKTKLNAKEILNPEKDINIDSTAKKSPPKTLNIRTISPSSEDSSQVPRKLVSSKIKNLMGKMGDLKILSPMDTPPLWRKSEDRTDEDEDVVDKDSDGGFTSTYDRVSPPSISESGGQKESLHSTSSIASNTETAISFDDLAQVETLSTTASKSRVRIQAKRRPQSRHARKSALRQSEIDFDTVDNVDNDSQEESHASTFSHTSKHISTTTASADRLTINDNTQRTIDPSLDDKSELGSISKESSMSINKNTLLSPSTDEEDLFDVPPDLPEDPQREDTLFGRAPILSPINGEQPENTFVSIESLTQNTVGKINNNDSDINATSDKNSKWKNSEELLSNMDNNSHMSKEYERRDEKHTEVTDDKQDEIERTETNEEPNDPLRDSSHDPLKNPSQLFAFVIKTPSPDKGKGLLFSEDDSLFSGTRKTTEEQFPKKEILDLFADDAGNDLFSAPLKKTVKKPLKDTKISLFDDDDAGDDEDDNLFGSASNKAKVESQKSNSTHAGRRKNLFDENNDDDSTLFIESSSQSQKSDNTSISEIKHENANSIKSSNLKDIFNEPSCDDFDDIFAKKKIVPKRVAPSMSLFASDDDEDDGHIFGKPSISTDLKAGMMAGNRSAVKKLVGRDLKKTAEKIAEDPLSLLQDD